MHTCVCVRVDISMSHLEVPLLKVAIHLRAPTSHTFTVSSSDAVASKFPSGEKEHHLTPSSCPVSSPKYIIWRPYLAHNNKSL